MTTSGISGVLGAQDSNSNSGSKSATSGLGQDAFLRLLTTQLQHQDPLQPKEDGEFIAQLAQFSSLEKLTEISASIQELARLIGEQQQTPTGSSTDASQQTGSNTGSTTGGQ